MKKIKHRWLSFLLTLSIVLGGATNVFATGTVETTALNLGEEKFVSIEQDGDEKTFTYTAAADGTYIIYFRDLTANPIGLYYTGGTERYHHHPARQFEGHVKELKAGETIHLGFHYPQFASTDDIPEGYSGYTATVGVTTLAEESSFDGFAPRESFNSDDPNIYTPIEDGTLGLKFYTNDPFAYGVTWSATSADSSILELESETSDAVSYNPVFKLNALGTTSITINATYGSVTKSETYSVEVFERGSEAPEGPSENNQFADLAALKVLLQDPDQSGRTLFYNGSSALEIDENLEIPNYISLELHDRELIVAQGVNFTIYNRIHCGDLTVAGTMNAEDRFDCEGTVTVSGTLNAVNGFRAGDTLAVTGSVSMENDGIQMQYPASISGIDKIQFGQEWMRIRSEVPYSSMSELKTALTQLATDYVDHERVEYQLFMSSSNGSEFVINENITVPEHVEWPMREQEGFSIATGTTVTVNGRLGVQTPLVVNGSLVNQGLINLDKMDSNYGMITFNEGAVYSGENGDLVCHTKSVAEIDEVLLGFNWEGYSYSSDIDPEGITHWHVRYGSQGPDGEEPGHAVGFATVAELKNAVAEHTGEDRIILAYTGTTALEITEEISIPENFELELNGKDLTIATNGVLNVDGNLNCENLTVAGTMVASERFWVAKSVTVSGSLQAERAFHAGNNLTVTGTLIVSNDTIGMNYPAAVSGMAKIQFGGEGEHKIRVEVPYGSFAELKQRLDEMAASHIEDERVIYNLWLPEEAAENMSTFVISESVTLPEYVEMQMERCITYEIAAGQTLTNNSMLNLNSPLFVNGELENNGRIGLHRMHDTNSMIIAGTNGVLSGTGVIEMHTDSSVTDWKDLFSGFNLDNYDVIDQNFDREEGITHTHIKNVAGLIKLGTPINLTWGIEYRERWHWDEDTQEDIFDGYEVLEKPGFTSWDTVTPDQAEIDIKIYRVGEDAPCAEGRWGFGPEFQPEHRSLDVFNISDLPSGTYYFTVQSIGDYIEYRNSDVAVSDTYTYVNPDVQLAACTDLHWEDREDEFVNWAVWTDNADRLLLDGYQIDYYWCATENGEYEQVGGVGGRGGAHNEEPFHDWFLQERGTGFYKFRVRVLSADIEVACNSPWSEFSPALNIRDITGEVNADLKQIIDDVNSGVTVSAENIKAAVQEMDTRDLQTALLTDTENNGTTQMLADLENEVGGAAPVVVTPAAQNFNASDVSIVGANLNNKADATEDPIQLVLDKPEKDHVIPELYNSSVAVKFSMTLENVEDPEELKVPVKITLPIPASINPEFVVIFHYHVDGTHEVLHPHVYEDNGKFYADFVLTSFSDFAITEHVHEWKDEPSEVIEATCAEVGANIYECKLEDCQETYWEEIPVSTEHKNIVKAEAAAPSYFDYGNIECYVCTVCDSIFMDAEGTQPVEEEDVLIPPLEIENNTAYSEEDSLELPQGILEGLESLTIQLKDLAVILDAQTLSLIEDFVKLEVKLIGEDELADVQKDVLKELGTKKLIVSANMISGETAISNFEGGKVMIKIPFKLDEGASATDYQVLYVGLDGSLEEIESEYVEEENQGFMVITTTHFSEFVIVYNEDASSDEDNSGEDGSQSQPGGSEEDGSQTQPGGSDEGDSQTQPEDTTNNKPGVDTGDHNQIGMYVMLMAVCAAGLVIMLVMKKKA